MTNPYDELNQYNSDQPQDGATFYAPPAEKTPVALAARANVRKKEDERRRRLLGLPHFDANEFEHLMKLWSAVAPNKVIHNADGIRFETTDNDTVHIRKDRITIGSNSSDNTLRMMVLHAKQNWNNGLRPLFEGNDQLKARVWVHCQVHGVNYGWQPSPEVADMMAPMIASLRAKEEFSAQSTTKPSADTSTAESPMHRAAKHERYQPPRNAVADLFADATPEMRQAMREPLAEIQEQNPIGTWPSEPYHYGMGRIMAYEMWLERLSPEDLAKERAASRARYEAHYNREASQLTEKMRDLGYSMSEPAPQAKAKARTDTDDHDDVRGNDQPTLAGESKAAMRARVARELDERLGIAERPSPRNSRTVPSNSPSLGGGYGR